MSVCSHQHECVTSLPRRRSLSVEAASCETETSARPFWPQLSKDELKEAAAMSFVSDPHQTVSQ